MLNEGFLPLPLALCIGLERGIERIGVDCDLYNPKCI